MKALSYRGSPEKDFGLELHKVDKSEAYEIDEITLWVKDGVYTVLSAEGCSCWDGDYTGWGELTKDELQKLARGWLEKGDTKEKEMAAWILESVAEEAEVVDEQ